MKKCVTFLTIALALVALFSSTPMPAPNITPGAIVIGTERDSRGRNYLIIYIDVDGDLKAKRLTRDGSEYQDLVFDALPEGGHVIGGELFHTPTWGVKVHDEQGLCWVDTDQISTWQSCSDFGPTS